MDRGGRPAGYSHLGQDNLPDYGLPWVPADDVPLAAGFRTSALEHSMVVGAELAHETSLNHTRVETGPTLTASRPIDAAGKATPFARTDEMLSWRAGVAYKPRANGSVHAGAGTSLDPSAEGSSLSASTAALPPETSFSYEVGTKWDLLQQRLSVTAAAFRTEKSNARTPGINAGDPPTVLQGEHRVDGLDVGLSGRITRRWRRPAASSAKPSGSSTSLHHVRAVT